MALVAVAACIVYTDYEFEFNFEGEYVRNRRNGKVFYSTKLCFAKIVYDWR
jgi:hypothetical protein